MMELIGAAATLGLAKGGNQVALDLGASVPGLLGVTVRLAIGEPPQRLAWFSVGPEGETVRTAQTRLLTVVELSAGGLLGASVRLPLYVELASAEARLSRVTCEAGGSRVSVAARPGIAAVRIADPDTGALTNFSRAPALSPARLVTLPLLKVTGAAHVEMANQNFSTLQFSASDIRDGKIKRVSTTDFTSSLTASLLGNLSVGVDIGGLGLGLGSPALVRSTLTTLLSTATPVIDQTLASVLGTLGITLGEADVRVHAASCGRAVLVQ